MTQKEILLEELYEKVQQEDKGILIKIYNALLKIIKRKG